MPDLFHELERDGPQYHLYQNAPANAWDDYPIRVIATNDGVTLTPSINNPAHSAPPAGVMRVTATAGTNGNHREFFLNPNKASKHSEIRSILFGGGTWATAGTRTQQGHVHRFQRLGNGRARAFVAWHDVFVGAPTVINLNIWEGPVGTMDTSAGVGLNAALTLTPVAPIPVTFSSRAGNTTTAQTNGRNYLKPLSLVSASFQNSALNITNVRVSLFFGTAILWPHTGADVADGGGGLITPQGPLADFPYVLVSQLLPGNVFRAKIYRVGDPEPPWSTGVQVGFDDEPSQILPNGVGMPGLFVGHVDSGELVDFGLPLITPL